MHKCHNYHAILHKLYMWFGTEQKKFDWGAAPAPPPLNTYVAVTMITEGWTGYQFSSATRDLTLIQLWSWQVCRFHPFPTPFTSTLQPFPYLSPFRIILLET